MIAFAQKNYDKREYEYVVCYSMLRLRYDDPVIIMSDYNYINAHTPHTHHQHHHQTLLSNKDYKGFIS